MTLTVFDSDRAKSLDAIWEVLRNPQAVNWSLDHPPNKTFDRRVNLSRDGFGRVVLEPTPTPDDIAANKVTHFDFVSWHPITRGKFDAARRAAAVRHVSPTAIMKKAIPERMALFASRTLSPGTVESWPVSEGIAFNWGSYFYEGHSRIPEGTDGVTETHGGNSSPAEFFKALPPGSRWITVRPNGPGTEGHPVLIQPAGDGAYHVIGGAGGKLNFLKLRNVKSEADYKQEAAASAVGRREEKKRLRERDRENGLHESKQRARQALRDALHAEQAK